MTALAHDRDLGARQLNLEELPPEHRLPDWVRTMIRNPVSITGVILVLAFVVIAILAPVIAPPEIPDDPFLMPRDGYSAEPQPPNAAHPFGTTQGQYDIFYGIVWGTRTAFEVGLIVTFSTALIGGALGAITAYVGGWVDEVFQRIAGKSSVSLPGCRVIL